MDIYREHAIRIADEAGLRILEKYKKGQEEHGGFLAEVPAETLLNHALDEATDQMTYLITLRDQFVEMKDRIFDILESIDSTLDTNEIAEYTDEIRDILEGRTEEDIDEEEETMAEVDEEDFANFEIYNYDTEEWEPIPTEEDYREGNLDRSSLENWYEDAYQQDENDDFYDPWGDI